MCCVIWCASLRSCEQTIEFLKIRAHSILLGKRLTEQILESFILLKIIDYFHEVFKAISQWREICVASTVREDIVSNSV